MTPTPNPPALLPVIQADREAAANLIVPDGRWPGFSSDFRMGRADENELTQAFARHRLQSTPAEPEELARRLVAQMEAQADDNTPSSIQSDKGLVWLEGWFDLSAATSADRPAEPKVSREAVAQIIRGNCLCNQINSFNAADAILALSNPPVDGASLRVAAINAALCLSGFAGEGIEIEGFQAPEDAYGAITVALGIPDADDDDLRAALRALLKPSAPFGALEGER